MLKSVYHTRAGVVSQDCNCFVCLLPVLMSGDSLRQDHFNGYGRASPSEVGEQSPAINFYSPASCVELCWPHDFRVLTF